MRSRFLIAALAVFLSALQAPAQDEEPFRIGTGGTAGTYTGTPGTISVSNVG